MVGRGTDTTLYAIGAVQSAALSAIEHVVELTVSGAFRDTRIYSFEKTLTNIRQRWQQTRKDAYTPETLLAWNGWMLEPDQVSMLCAKSNQLC